MRHIKQYADMIIGLLDLDNNSKIIEIGSNDGYLLHFFSEREIPVLGIEPAINIAQEAINKNIPTITKFFGLTTRFKK